MRISYGPVELRIDLTFSLADCFLRGPVLSLAFLVIYVSLSTVKEIDETNLLGSFSLREWQISLLRDKVLVRI